MDVRKFIYPTKYAVLMHLCALGSVAALLWGFSRSDNMWLFLLGGGISGLLVILCIVFHILQDNILVPQAFAIFRQHVYSVTNGQLNYVLDDAERIVTREEIEISHVERAKAKLWKLYYTRPGSPQFRIRLREVNDELGKVYWLART